MSPAGRKEPDDRGRVVPLDYDTLRRALLRERRRLEKRTQRDDADLARYREGIAHRDPCQILSPSAAKEDADYQTRHRLAQQARSQLDEVMEALLRLQEDPANFGVCIQCGTPISPARLELLPHVQHCSRCADRLD